jgi:hypothetical protein
MTSSFVKVGGLGCTSSWYVRVHLGWDLGIRNWGDGMGRIIRNSQIIM